MSSRNLTIMFTDIKGFTERVSAGSRADLTRLRAEHDRLLLPVVRHFGGTLVKTIGDALLVRFESPTDAVLCGLAIQEVLRQHAATVADGQGLAVRVAINSGDVEVSDGDVLGEPVNIAARLEGVAEAGEVWFTEAVYLAMNRSEAPSAEVGERTFKGIPHAVRVYRAVQDPGSDLELRLREAVRLTREGPVIESPQSRQGWRAKAVGAAAVFLALGGLATLLLRPSGLERALARAERSLASGNALEALEAVRPFLAEPPSDSGFLDLARRAASAHLAGLRSRTGAAPALAWLETELTRAPALEPLRSEVGSLTGQALAESLLASGEDPWPAVQGMLARRPRDADAAWAVAVGLEGKVYPFAPLRAFQQALDLGHPDAEGRALAACLRVFERHSPSGGAALAHQILGKHLQEQRLAWARAALDGSTSGYALENSRAVLREAGDPMADAPAVVPLFDLLDGYEDESVADAALSHFRAETAADRRGRILGLHRFVVDPGGPWFWHHKELVERNLARLEEAWAEAP